MPFTALQLSQKWPSRRIIITVHPVGLGRVLGGFVVIPHEILVSKSTGLVISAGVNLIPPMKLQASTNPRLEETRPLNCHVKPSIEGDANCEPAETSKVSHYPGMSSASSPVFIKYSRDTPRDAQELSLFSNRFHSCLLEQIHFFPLSYCRHIPLHQILPFASHPPPLPLLFVVNSINNRRNIYRGRSTHGTEAVVQREWQQ